MIALSRTFAVVVGFERLKRVGVCLASIEPN